ncbi:MAG: DUF4203 domain-containing protein [Planctomycetes bacterium]|nr:DUF4203 domain-containing protein [Planctomycetota bacterium]
MDVEQNIPASMPAGLPAFDQATLDRISNARLPDHSEIIGFIRGIEPLQAALLAACGVIYLLYGWKAFKALVIVNAAILGAAAGALLAVKFQHQDLWLYAAGGGAALAGLLAWPFMRLAVALMGGLAGAIFGRQIFIQAVTILERPELLQYSWAGCIVAGLIFSLLAFMVFRLVVIILTSFQGGGMIFCGLAAMMLRIPELSDKVGPELRNNVNLVPIAIIAIAACGFLYQLFRADPPPAPAQPAPAG